MGKNEEALKNLEEAFVIEKRSPYLISNLITAYKNLNFCDKIEEILLKENDVIFNMMQAQQIINTLLSIKKYDLAIHFIKSLKKIYNEKNIIYDEDKIHFSTLIRALGEILFEKKDYAGALGFFEEYNCKIDKTIIQKNLKTHIDFLKKYGISYYHLGEKEKALSILDQAISYDKQSDYDCSLTEDSELYFLSGTIKMDLSKHEEALISFKESLELDENNALSYMAMAQTYMKLKNYDYAEDILIKAMELELHHRNIEILFLKSQINFKQEQYESSIDALISYLDNGGEKPISWNAIGLCLYNLQDYERSIEFFMQAIEEENQNSNYYINLGNTLLKMKKYEDANSAYECALAIDKNNEHALLGLSMIDIEKKLNI
jgi:tetratricopeptide (TPR) repeat protein